MTKAIRQSRRNLFQRCFSDPLSALFILIIYTFLRLLPPQKASSLGALLGALLYKIMAKRNQIGRRNLEIAFPQKTIAEREKILKDMWCHWGRFFAEMPHGEEFFKTARKKGLLALQEVAKQKQGCFICSAHLGNWEPAVSAPIFDGYYLNPVYRAANNPWIDKIMFQRRKGTLIPKGILGARKMVEVLHKGGAVVMMCDQKLREGIDVPFFGKPAKTTPAVATIALKLKLPIFMARSIRGKDGIFDMEITRLDTTNIPENTDAVYYITEKINKTIEQWVFDNPEQWLWVHHRFDKSEYR